MPVVLAEPQTHNGADPIVVRTRNVTASGFEVRLQEQESEGPHTTETIGYVAIEAGGESLPETLFTVGRTGDNVYGMGGSGDLWGDPYWHSISLPTAEEGQPYDSYVTLAQQQTIDGGNTAGLRMRRAMGTDLALKYWNILLPGGETVGRVLPDGSRRYYMKDHLGSIRAVIDGGGNVVERRNYYPFGLRMPGRTSQESPTETEEDFTGHVLDNQTHLHYAGARYYSAAFGRWTTTDPILERKGPKVLLGRDQRLLSMSPYNYAFSNPISLRDPTGMAPCCLSLNPKLTTAALQGMAEVGKNIAEGARDVAESVGLEPKRAAEATKTTVKKGPEVLDDVATGATGVAVVTGTAAVVTGPGFDDVALAPTAAVSSKLAVGAQLTAAGLSAIDAAVYGGSEKEAKARAAGALVSLVTGSLPAKSLDKVLKGAPGITKQARKGAAAAIGTPAGAAGQKSVEQISNCDDEPNCR